MDIETNDTTSLTDGAHRLRFHATHDPKDTIAAGRAAFLAKFAEEVDPKGELPAAERERRAEYARLAYLSAKARKERKQTKAAGADTPTAEEGE